MSLTLTVKQSTHLFKTIPIFAPQKNTLFYWINLQFNAVDADRRKEFGPDRTCAEWILRNGGKIKWVDSKEPVFDYNEIPKEGTALRLKEIDATDSSIMFNGFEHLKGCNYIDKIILHKCNYLEDKALVGLKHVENTLVDLQVSSCLNIGPLGLFHLTVLQKLKKLLLFDLPLVKDKAKVMESFDSNLPNCKVQFD